MKNYTLQLDLSGGKNPNGLFLVDAVSVAPFTEQPIDEMPVTRKAWGEVKFRNMPYLSSMLYDVIQEQLPTQEIHIKFTSDVETLTGYFGVVDCKVDDDNKVISVNVTELDEYTPFMEGRETEIKLFDDYNIIRNGKFDRFADNKPEEWTKNTPETVCTQTYFKEKTAVVLPRIYDLLGIGKSGINQSNGLCLKDKNIVVKLSYILIGESADREDLQYKLVLTGTNNTYDLAKDGSWIAYNPSNSITFRTSAVAIPINSANDYFTYNLVSEKLPENGTVQIYIYHQSDTIFTDDSYLYVSEARIETPSIELKTIKVNFLDSNLVSAPQTSDTITWKSKSAYDLYFRTQNGGTRNWDTSQFDCADYFNPDGSPNITELSSSDNGIKSNSGITYQDLQDIFDNDPNNSFFKGEMSEITVYRGAYSYFNFRRLRSYYAIATYTREEYYKTDEYDSNNVLIPPEVNVGWVRTTTRNLKGQNLWVRKPFNGTATTWVLGDLVDAPKTTDFNLVYHASLTSKRQYPVDETKSVELDTAIDLREMIRKVYTSTNEELIGKNVYSTFFWNNTQSADIQKALFTNGNTNSNYVTGAPVNPLNKIAVIHTNDLSTEPSLDEEKSILKISGKKLLDDLRILFPQIYWYIDADKNLHIEHIKFFDKTNNLKSLLGSEYDYIRDFKSWDYLKDKMFSLEEYEVKNAGYNDFKTSKVTFDKIVSNKRGDDIKGSYTTQNLTTDIQYCIENPDSLDNGMILVCYEEKDGYNIVKYATGQKTGKSVINGDLSIATLLYNYARYEGTYLKGKINDKDATFEFTKRVRQGKEITFKGIFEDKLILNDIGRGLLKNATYDYMNENTKATFVYRYANVAMSNGGTNIIDTGAGDPIQRAIPGVLTMPLGQIVDLGSYFFVWANGFVSTDNNSDITERGFCYSTSPNPTIASTKSVVTGTTGSMAKKIRINTEGTYYLKAYATNGIGTAYGTEIQFTLNFISE